MTRTARSLGEARNLSSGRLSALLVPVLAVLAAAAGHADGRAAQRVAAADPPRATEARKRAEAFWQRSQNDAWEAKLGQRMLGRAVKDMGGLWTQADQQARVDRLGKLLVPGARPRGFAYTFLPVDTPEINAGSLIGGYVLVTRGLLAVSNDAELAACLAHEIAHTDLNHGRKQLQRELKIEGLLEKLSARSDDQVDEKVAELMYGRWKAARSREEEMEADLRGQQLILAAGLDPMGQVSSLWKVAAGPMATTVDGPDRPPGGDAPGVTHYVYIVPRKLFEEDSGVPNQRMELLLQDHPPVQERIQVLSGRLRAMGRYVPPMGPYMPEDDPDPRTVDPGLFAGVTPRPGPKAAGVSMCFPWSTVYRAKAAQPPAQARRAWQAPRASGPQPSGLSFEWLQRQRLPGRSILGAPGKPGPGKPPVAPGRLR